MLKSKRVVVISDTHSGHKNGLTNPDYFYPIVNNPTTQTLKDRNKSAKIQRSIWQWYAETLKRLQPIDTLFHMGDAIDGAAFRNGGVEELTTDPLKQCEIAVACIDEAKAKNVILLRGTPYHAGKETDFEDVVFDKIKVPGIKKIGCHEWVEFGSNKNAIKPIIFDLKHKIGGSGTPYSQGTAIAKDRLHNQLWAERDLQPKSTILIRGHVHKDFYVGDGDFLAMTVPGLQWTTAYGAKECSSRVAIGITVFTIFPDNSYDWHFELARSIPEMKAISLKMA